MRRIGHRWRRTSRNGTGAELTRTGEPGFGLLQEREGVWWSDQGQHIPAADRVTLRPLTAVGPAVFGDAVARAA